MSKRIGPGAFVFDEWARRHSPLHSAEPRLKLLTCLALLVCTGTWPGAWRLFVLIPLLALIGRVPVAGLAARAALVLPFTVVFALLTAWMGDWPRAVALLWKSYLSALWVGLLMATTPLEKVLEAAARLGVPRILVDVTHFTWRYLAVIGAQALRLRRAALARGGEGSFQVSASSLAMLFASSYARAERVHRAMLARGAAGER